MKNNKLMIIREGLFSKMLKKIKLFFFKNNNVQETEEKKNEIIKSDFKEKIKAQVKIDKNYPKDQFMEEISGSLSLLENLSLERLIKIREYWQNRIKQQEQILRNMKKNS